MAVQGSAAIRRTFRRAPWADRCQKPTETTSSAGSGGFALSPAGPRPAPTPTGGPATGPGPPGGLGGGPPSAAISAQTAALTAVTVTVAVLVRGQWTA